MGLRLFICLWCSRLVRLRLLLIALRLCHRLRIVGSVGVRLGLRLIRHDRSHFSAHIERLNVVLRSKFTNKPTVVVALRRLFETLVVSLNL